MANISEGNRLFYIEYTILVVANIYLTDTFDSVQGKLKDFVVAYAIT